MWILSVEDEPDMASALSDALARHKIVIDHVTTLIDARAAARLLSYDPILLGPSVDGWRGPEAHS